MQVLDQDVFVSVAGGARVDEPAVDLALALAVASSLRDRPVPRDMVVFGEVGLTGEVRAVPRAAARLAEAQKLGFTRVSCRTARARGRGPRSAGAAWASWPARTLHEALVAALSG